MCGIILTVCDEWHLSDDVVDVLRMFRMDNMQNIGRNGGLVAFCQHVHLIGLVLHPIFSSKCEGDGEEINRERREKRWSERGHHGVGLQCCQRMLSHPMATKQHIRSCQEGESYRGRSAKNIRSTPRRSVWREAEGCERGGWKDWGLKEGGGGRGGRGRAPQRNPLHDGMN